MGKPENGPSEAWNGPSEAGNEASAAENGASTMKLLVTLSGLHPPSFCAHS